MKKKVENLNNDELKKVLNLVIEENNDLTKENENLKKTIKKLECLLNNKNKY